MDRLNSTPNPQLPTLSRGVVATVTVPITEEPVQVSTDSSTISTSVTTRPLEPVPSYAEMLKLCQPKNVSEAAESKKSAMELPMTSVTVKRGDSVWSLLLAQGYSGGEIFSQNLIKLVADKNSLANANHITVGQSLQVPTKGEKSGEREEKKPETTTTRRRRPAPTQRTPKPQVLRRPVVQRRTTPAQTQTPKQTQTPTQTQTPVQKRPQPKQPQQPTRKTDWGGFGGGGDFDGGGAGGSW